MQKYGCGGSTDLISFVRSVEVVIEWEILKIFEPEICLFIVVFEIKVLEISDIYRLHKVSLASKIITNCLNVLFMFKLDA